MDDMDFNTDMNMDMDIDYDMDNDTGTSAMDKNTKDGDQKLKPIAQELRTVFDIKEWIKPHIQKMKFHKGPHCYKIERDATGKAVVYFKHWSYSLDWQEAVPRDDSKTHFLTSKPDAGSINLAETQYGKSLGLGENENVAQSPVIATIRKCFGIIDDKEIEDAWNKWIQEATNAVEDERRLKQDGLRTSAVFESYETLLANKKQQSFSPSRQRALITDDYLPENQPIPQVVFGRVNRIFRCKTKRSDDDANGRYQVGDMVLLDVEHWKQKNQVGQIVGLCEEKVTIIWYDGMPSTSWKEYKKRNGKKMEPYQEEITTTAIISDGFQLTKTKHLPGDAKAALQAYWEAGLI